MDLMEARGVIDGLDTEIARLFEARMDAAAEIVAYKRENGLPVLDAAREAAKLEDVARLVRPELREHVRTLYGAMFSASRAYQRELLAGVAGPGFGRDSGCGVALIGMPGCGKSRVGRALAEMAGRPFVDCDQLVERMTGTPIPAMLAGEGEAAFRRAETAALRRAAAVPGAVLATGGGAVTVPENREILSASCALIWIRTPLERLSTENRPISAARGVEALWRERGALYAAWSDAEYENTGERDTARRILRDWLGEASADPMNP